MDTNLDGRLHVSRLAFLSSNPLGLMYLFMWFALLVSVFSNDRFKTAQPYMSLALLFCSVLISKGALISPNLRA